MPRSSFFISEKMATLLFIYKTKFGGQTDALMIVLDRYNTLVSQERRGLQALFSEQELSFLRSLLPKKCIDAAGIIPDFFTMRITAQEGQVFTRNKLSRADLLKKVKQLSLGQEIALIDYLETLPVSEE